MVSILVPRVSCLSAPGKMRDPGNEDWIVSFYNILIVIHMPTTGVKERFNFFPQKLKHCLDH